MKKFLIVFVMFLPCLLGAQERLSQAAHPGVVASGLIREYRYPVTLGYVETDGKHLFLYNDGSQTVAEVKIDPKYHVSDMEVLDNYLYFCGQDVVQMRGFVGWFKIEGFFGGGATYNIYNLFDFSASQAWSQQDRIIDLSPVPPFTTPPGCMCARRTRMTLGATR